MAEDDWRKLVIKQFKTSRRTFERRRDQLKNRDMITFKDEKWSKK